MQFNIIVVILLMVVDYVTATSSVDWLLMGDDIDGEAAGDHSGTSISLSVDGSTVAIGAPKHDGNENDSGHVRVYGFDLDQGAWAQKGSDINGEDGLDNFGFSVSLSGNGSTVAIGAPLHDGNSGHVRVYGFDLDQGAWVQKGSDINGEAGNVISGISVSLSADGSTVAVGAYYEGLVHLRVYGFDLDQGDWAQKGSDIYSIDPADSDLSGISVSLSADGSTVSIGDPGAGNVRVYLFDLDLDLDQGDWAQKGSDIEGEAISVSLSADGSTVALGVPFNDGNGTDSGHVRVYGFDQGAWVQKGSDIDGEAAYDLSGESVSLSGNGSTVAIGAAYNDDNGPDSGHVRVYGFDLDQGAWAQKGSDIDGEASRDGETIFSIQWGSPVSLSAYGSTVAIGAAGNDGNGIDSGHVRVYSFGIRTASPTKNPTSSPTTSPTKSPTKNPTSSPTASPTKNPSSSPTTSPTTNPTTSPTASPTKNPTSSPTKNPTSSPTKNPTASPTKNPSSSPTTSPTTNPTTSPTTSPTKNPTSSPTTSPTKNPTSSPTTSPTADCRGSLAIFADTAARTSSFQVKRQVDVLEALFEDLPIKLDGIHVTLVGDSDAGPVDFMPSAAGGFSFNTAEDYWGREETYNATTVTASFEDFVENNMNQRRRYSDPRLFFDDYGTRRSQGRENPTLLLMSDGRPQIEELKIRNRRKWFQRSLQVSCDAARAMREAAPDVKVLCFQGHNTASSTKFYKCACDATWLARPKNREIPSADLVAQQIQAFICTTDAFEKKSNPCEQVNLDNPLLTTGPRSRRNRARKRACAAVRRDPYGDPYDPNSVLQDPKTIRRQCKMVSNGKTCVVYNTFAALYLPIDATR